MLRTILIVEDSESCRDTLEIALMKLPDIVIRAVATAGEALKCLAAYDVSAAIIDLHLPSMDGFELIQAIRAQPERSSLPIVVISGDSDPDTPGRLHALGTHAYFVKPYSPTEVRTKLEQLIYES